MYSPGAENVAVVDALPWASRAGLGFANVTFPGPRNLLQYKVAVVAPRPAVSRSRLPSSVTHTVKSTGSDPFAVIVCAIPIGGPVKAVPFGSNLMTGGVLPTPASL